MDHGMTAGVGGYFDEMQQRFRRDVPAIDVRRVPSSIAGGSSAAPAFIDDLSNEPSVAKPVGDLYIGTHASSDGFLFVRLFRGQIDNRGNPTDVTDYEVLDQAMGPARPAKIPDSLVGYQRGNPLPPPTHSVHIKGCNIGRDRFLPKSGVPVAPFLARLKQVFGGNVNVTAPKHFHGLIPENHGGVFEYMAQELIVRTKARFANRGALINAYKAAGLKYYDGTPIPDADWNTLVPRRMADNRKIPMTIPLGRTVEKLSSVRIRKQFRIQDEKVDWPITFPDPTAVPTAYAQRLTKLSDSIAADPRFLANHAWPMYERRGFADLASYMAGYKWEFSVSRRDPATLVCVGRRFVYTIVQPIVDRSVTPPANRPLIFNFYPGVSRPGAPRDPPVLTGLVESDNRFFGRA